MYPVLSRMEEVGRVRRGYFVEGLGGAQFALPGAVDRLRSPSPRTGVVGLASTDPANPVRCRSRPGGPNAEAETRFARSAGSYVFLVGGSLAGYLERGGKRLTFSNDVDRPPGPDRPRDRLDRPSTSPSHSRNRRWFARRSTAGWRRPCGNGGSCRLCAAWRSAADAGRRHLRPRRQSSRSGLLGAEDRSGGRLGSGDPPVVGQDPRLPGDRCPFSGQAAADHSRLPGSPSAATWG